MCTSQNATITAIGTTTSTTMARTCATASSVSPDRNDARAAPGSHARSHSARPAWRCNRLVGSQEFIGASTCSANGLHDQLAALPMHAVQPQGRLLEHTQRCVGKSQDGPGPRPVSLHALYPGKLELRVVLLEKPP